MKMKPKTAVVVGIAVLAVVGLLTWALAPRPLLVETARPSSGPFELRIEEDGRTRLRERHVIQAPVHGRLRRITLREGDDVAAQAVVAVIEPAAASLVDARTRAELQARLGAALANRQRAATRVEVARVAAQQARNEQQRTEQLARQGFVSPTQLDRDRLAVQAAQAEHEAAIDGEHVAAHEWQQARAALGPATAGATPREHFEIRTPVGGRVLKVHQISEGSVAPGTPLLDIGDTARLEVVAELLTTDALSALPGTPVRIHGWGGPTVLEGRVRRVEPAAFTKVSALGVEEQRVNVIIDIVSPLSQWSALGDGYRVSLSLLVRREDAVLRVPVSAVFPREGAPDPAEPAATSAGGAARPAAMAVFVIEDGVARLRQVEIGARNASMAWVKSGLDPQATLIVYPPAGVTDGRRVKPRPPG